MYWHFVPGTVPGTAAALAACDCRAVSVREERLEAACAASVP